MQRVILCRSDIDTPERCHAWKGLTLVSGAEWVYLLMPSVQHSICLNAGKRSISRLLHYYSQDQDTCLLIYVFLGWWKKGIRTNFFFQFSITTSLNLPSSLLVLCLFIPVIRTEVIPKVGGSIIIEVVKLIVTDDVYLFGYLIENQGGISF